MHFLVVTSALGCAVGYPVLASFEAHVEKRGAGVYIKFTKHRTSLRKPVSFTIKAPTTEHPLKQCRVWRHTLILKAHFLEFLFASCQLE